MSSLTSADFNKDAENEIPRGRGLRESHVTERMQKFKETVAQDNAAREARASRRATAKQAGKRRRLHSQDSSNETHSASDDQEISPAQIPESQPQEYDYRDESLSPPPPSQPRGPTRPAVITDDEELEEDVDRAPNNISVGSQYTVPTSRPPSRPPPVVAPPSSQDARNTQLVAPSRSASDLEELFVLRHPYVMRTGKNKGKVIMPKQASNQSRTPGPSPATPTIQPSNPAHSGTVSEVHQAVPPEATASVADSTQQVPKKPGRPKASNYEDISERGLMNLACSHFRLLVATDEPFAGTQVDDMAAFALRRACEDKGLDMVQITEDDVKLIKARAPQMRGEVVSAAKARVAAAYGFTTDDMSNEAILKNRNLYDELMTRAAFSYKDPGSRAPGTMLRHRLIQEIINYVWFRNAKDEGVVFARYFDEPGIPLATIALVLTAIECALDEYKSGCHAQHDFTEKVYAKAYRLHYMILIEWSEKSATWGSGGARSLQREMLRNARVSAGCEADADVRSACLSFEDIEADRPRETFPATD